jgi:predicted short-subunit dehydrogenase-like oxidoreductase (DUF2520 family)
MNTINFVGAGNVAWHLAQALFSAGYHVSQVWSRTEQSAESLAQLVKAEPITDLNKIEPGADVYLLCLNDDAMPSVIQNLSFGGSLVLHTSGTLRMDVLAGVSENFGVFYPLQTFSKGIPLDIQQVPFFLEASSAANLQRIERLASALSSFIFHADSQTRLNLHVAAVFAGNYSNFMYVLASDLLSATGFNLDVLRPLMVETTHKALESDPITVQTGPARRNDTTVILKHLETLASKPEFAEIYRHIARLIINRFHPGISNNAEL